MKVEKAEFESKGAILQQGNVYVYFRELLFFFWAVPQYISSLSLLWVATIFSGLLLLSLVGSFIVGIYKW